MRRHTLALVMLFLALSHNAWAQSRKTGGGDVVHVISCADINSRPLGRANMNAHVFFTTELPDSINYNTPHKAVAYDFSGLKFKRDYLVDRLANMKTTARDVILFHYAGNALTVQGDSLPVLNIATDSMTLRREEALFLSDVLLLLRSKPHRLLVIMCEGSRIELPDDVLSLDSTGRLGVEDVSDMTDTSYRVPAKKRNAWETLMAQRGNFLLLSCTRGQPSYVVGDNGLLDYYLRAAFNELSYGHNVTWPSLFGYVVQRTAQMATNMGIEQTPCWAELSAGK